MEYIVQGLLIYLGAPLALITPTVAAVIIAGYAFQAYEGAKDNANRNGSSISAETYFWVSIFLAMWSLSLVWTAIEVFAEV